MNTDEQVYETPVSAPTSRSSETGTSSTSSTYTWDHGTDEYLSESSPERERIDEEDCNSHADTRSDRVNGPSAANADAPSIDCSEIGASVEVVLRPAHMKLGCNKEVLIA
ncbi:hypothetical protein EVAR_61456_1 [Eumeta japonica]|uniref:Uncharacterized protein n=1 Tax=Eumeta variegata TaxID=151549 RepID=A0A4C1Z140_EUMVA|nr:hypothetical protein EVAR_61456_1 [Eumeta japonica]